MRHRISGRKLGMRSAHRLSTLKSMATALITHEKIETTLAKAKELRPFVEKIITLGKKNNLCAIRQANCLLFTDHARKKLFLDLSKRFSARNGGYTRILKKGFRYGDFAPVAIIEFVDKAAS